MILVDTSVWVDHFRKSDPGLVRWLEAGTVMAHPFVIGELALGGLKRRETILSMLYDLPAAEVASDAEVLQFIDRHRLAGSGVGYIDAHLLAAVRLTGGAALWTRDKRLNELAVGLDLAIDFPNR